MEVPHIHNEHRKRSAMRKLLQEMERPMNGLQMFLCGCVAGMFLAAIVIAALTF